MTDDLTPEQEFVQEYLRPGGSVDGGRLAEELAAEHDLSEREAKLVVVEMDQEGLIEKHPEFGTYRLPEQ